MRIIINTDQIYKHGGIEKVMSVKVNHWASITEVEVFIVTTEQKDNPPCYQLNKKIQLIDLGIDYDRNQSYFSAKNIRQSFYHFKRQKKLFDKLKPDIIISPNYNFDHYWIPFIKGGAKIIKERHGSGYSSIEQRLNATFFSNIKYKINDWVDSRYDSIVVLNEDETKYVNSNNVLVIPNPVEMSDLVSNVKAKQAVAAGRIAPIKGFDDLIKIWVKMSSDFPEWQLHIYGDDYLGTQKLLQETIDQAGLTNAIIFKGTVDNMVETMSSYSIYLMTSRTECFPMVLLEAMSVGLPVVSYDCPHGPKNIITDNIDGFLIPDKSIDIFSDQLKLLMSDEGLRDEMGEKAKNNVRKFSTSNVMKDWDILLNLPNV